MINGIGAERLRAGSVEPLSLYLDLEPKTKADLEVVSRVSLEFAGAIRELAFVLDPALSIRIELVSGTESSLSLNSILRSLGVKDKRADLSVKAVALAAATYFVAHTGDWVFQHVMDSLFTGHEKAALSTEQIDEIAQKTAAAVHRRVAAPQVGRVYRELQSDPAICGIGISRDETSRPRSVVPRSEFESRSSAISKDVERGSERERDEVVTLCLVSPVLEESRRQWRFRSGSIPLGAAMKDARFLDDMINGRTAIPMTSGIQMDVEMRTVEEKKGGVWHVKERSILQVRQIRPPSSQSSLDLPPPHGPK